MSLAKENHQSRQIETMTNDSVWSRMNFMSTLQIKGNWNIAKGKLKQKFAQLTDDDLQFVEGKEDELIGRIQKRTGQAQQNIRQAVKECCCGGN
jgi:uncharacterized protein YjbJ (UPF0337 family)